MTRKRDITVLFDLDGTLADHDGKLRKDYELIKSPNDPPLKSFDDDAPSYVKKRIDLIRSQEGWWENLKPLKLGVEILDLARELKFWIAIATKGPSSTNAWSEKKAWVENHIGKIGQEVDLYIVTNKSRLYGRALVDDYFGYLSPWLENRPRGIGIMPAQEWNKDFKHERVVRYNGENIEEVKKALKWAKDRKGPIPKFK